MFKESHDVTNMKGMNMKDEAQQKQEYLKNEVREKQVWRTPETKSYEPLNIVKGSVASEYSGLYTECSLYYYY